MQVSRVLVTVLAMLVLLAALALEINRQSRAAARQAAAPVAADRSR